MPRLPRPDPALTGALLCAAGFSLPFVLYVLGRCFGYKPRED